MCRRCDRNDQRSSGARWPWRGSGAARATAFILVVCAAAVLAACGSTPTAPKEDADAGTQPAASLEETLPAEAVQRFDAAVEHMSSGDLATAEQEFRALAAAYPSYSGPLLNLGILHANAGRLKEAEAMIRSALQRNASNAAAFNQLGIVYRRMGRFKEADEAYQHALQIDPQYAIAYLNLGVLCDLYLQQPQRALEAYERYLALATPPDEKVNGWVSELKRRLGEPRAARTQ